MGRYVRVLSAIVVMLSVIGAPAWLRAQQSTPGFTSEQGGASVEGTVRKVNPAKSTVEVATGRFGLWTKKLEVGSNTQIWVEGRKASMEDLHEGETVKASYETRLGEYFATSIDVIPAPEPGEMPAQPGLKTQ
jgi:Cu/Ag efflux protein CusF